MAFYMLQVGYNASATKAMVEHPQNREEMARKAAESLGGRIHAFYFSFGEFDAVIIAEMPDNVSAAAIAMGVGSAGAFSKFQTTVLMTAADGMEAMKKAKTMSYTPPR